MMSSHVTNAASPALVSALACAEAARRLWDYIDARLPEASRAELEAHLATCAACTGHVSFARTLRRALAELAHLTPDARHEELRTRLGVALANVRSRAEVPCAD